MRPHRGPGDHGAKRMLRAEGNGDRHGVPGGDRLKAPMRAEGFVRSSGTRCGWPDGGQTALESTQGPFRIFPDTAPDLHVRSLGLTGYEPATRCSQTSAGRSRQFGEVRPRRSGVIRNKREPRASRRPLALSAAPHGRERAGVGSPPGAHRVAVRAVPEAPSCGALSPQPSAPSCTVVPGVRSRATPTAGSSTFRNARRLPGQQTLTSCSARSRARPTSTSSPRSPLALLAQPYAGQRDYRPE